MKANVHLIDHVKRNSFYVFIIFLTLSALLAIASVISGDFGEFEIKVLATTSTIAITSICLLCCSSYTSKSQKSLPGIVGTIAAMMSATSLIAGIWSEINSETFWKTTAIFSIFAIAFAHTLALMTIRVKPTHAWFKLATAFNILGLAALISMMILAEMTNKGAYKIAVILAILATLDTLVLPILGKLAKSSPQQINEMLILTKRDDNTYEDNNGSVYKVNKIGGDPNETNTRTL